MTSVPATCGTSRTTPRTCLSRFSASLLRSSGVRVAERRLLARTNGLTGMMTQRLIEVPTLNPVQHVPRQPRAVCLCLHNCIEHYCGRGRDRLTHIALVVDEPVDDIGVVMGYRLRRRRII